jgi:Synergist-CTERM protein sorting domain-containing protein
VECTYDTCDPTSGCHFQPLANNCDDANVCTRDICSPEQGCFYEAMPDDLACGDCLICEAGACVDDPACRKSGCSAGGSRGGLVLLALLPLCLRRRAGWTDVL